MHTIVFEPLFTDLNPFLTKKSIEIHFYYHHMQYYKNLISLVPSPIEDLKNILNHYQDQKIQNNALQIINHNLFWKSLSIYQEDRQIEEILLKIDFYNRFRTAALSLFGSGWIWLTYSPQGFEIFSTPNAICPLDKQVLLVLDNWEHSFYIDYLWNKKEYIEHFFKVINLKFIRHQLEEINFNIENYIQSQTN